MTFSEFERVLSNTSQIELTTTGRVSGRESSRPVWFVREGDTLYLLPVAGSDSEWYKNVVKTPTIRLAAAGAQYSTRAKPVTDSGKVHEVVDGFSAKYGAKDVRAYYPKLDAAVEVPPQ
jgi:hypothetical protein